MFLSLSFWIVVNFGLQSSGCKGVNLFELFLIFQLFFGFKKQALLVEMIWWKFLQKLLFNRIFFIVDGVGFGKSRVFELVGWPIVSMFSWSKVACIFVVSILIAGFVFRVLLIFIKILCFVHQIARGFTLVNRNLRTVWLIRGFADTFPLLKAFLLICFSFAFVLRNCLMVRTSSVLFVFLWHWLFPVMLLGFNLIRKVWLQAILVFLIFHCVLNLFVLAMMSRWRLIFRFLDFFPFFID